MLPKFGKLLKTNEGKDVSDCLSKKIIALEVKVSKFKQHFILSTNFLPYLINFIKMLKLLE